MSSSRSRFSWTALTRFIPFVLLAILLCSIISLGLGSHYGRKLATHVTGYKSWEDSTAFLVFYCGFVPLITIFHACIDAILYHFSRLNPIYALVGSILWFGGWVAQTSLWSVCYNAHWLENWSCPEFDLEEEDFRGGVGFAKIIFAGIIIVLYMVYMTLASMLVHKMRREKRERRRSPVMGLTHMGSPTKLRDPA